MISSMRRLVKRTCFSHGLNFSALGRDLMGVGRHSNSRSTRMNDLADRLYEQVLVLRCQTGDGAAFGELVDGLRPGCGVTCGHSSARTAKRTRKTCSRTFGWRCIGRSQL